MLFTEFHVTAFTTLLVTIDPLGLVPLFLSLTSGMTRQDRFQVAIWATLIAFAILVVAILFGSAALQTLGITLPAFRVAGGLLLFYTAFEMVFEQRQPRKLSTAEAAVSRDAIRNIAAFPLAIPLMAGPGAIAACILLTDQAGSDIATLGTLVAITAVICLACLALFWLASPVDRLLGVTGQSVLTRLLGVILAALAVQFIADGVRGLIGAG